MSLLSDTSVTPHILPEFPATFVAFLTGMAAPNITVRILPTPHPQPLPQSPCDLQQLFIRTDHYTACRKRDSPMQTLITLQQFLQRTYLNAKFYIPCKSLRCLGPNHIRYPDLQQLQPQQLHVDLNFTWYSPLSFNYASHEQL